VFPFWPFPSWLLQAWKRIQLHLRCAQLERTQQIQQHLHPSIAESADEQGVVLLQFEISEAQRSIGRCIKGRVSPIDPERPLRSILNAIEPLIILQECVLPVHHTPLPHFFAESFLSSLTQPPVSLNVTTSLKSCSASSISCKVNGCCVPRFHTALSNVPSTR